MTDKITKLTYKEATGEEIVTTKKKEESSGKRLVTDRVSNPSGSVAGSASGDFHTYRHVRRREAERMEKMERDHAEKIAREEHKQRREDTKLEFQRKAEKRRMKRQRKKRRQNHAKMERELKKLKKSDSSKERTEDSAVKVAPPPPRSIEPPTNKNVFSNDGSFMATFGKLS